MEIDRISNLANLLYTAGYMILNIYPLKIAILVSLSTIYSMIMIYVIYETPSVFFSTFLPSKFDSNPILKNLPAPLIGTAALFRTKNQRIENQRVENRKMENEDKSWMSLATEIKNKIFHLIFIYTIIGYFQPHFLIIPFLIHFPPFGFLLIMLFRFLSTVNFNQISGLIDILLLFYTAL